MSEDILLMRGYDFTEFDEFGFQAGRRPSVVTPDKIMDLSDVGFQRRHFPEVKKSDEDCNFTLTTERKMLCDIVFDSWRPQAGRLSEKKVRRFLMTSELPDSTLDKIWELSDLDADGFLDRYEFTVAFHLTDKVHLDYQMPYQVVINKIS